MTTDNGLAALAAAVFDAHAEYPYLDVGDRELAAFLIGALKGWELVPTGSADWDNGYDTGRNEQAATIAALRAALDRLVAAAHIHPEAQQPCPICAAVAAARAALATAQEAEEWTAEDVAELGAALSWEAGQ